MAANSRIQYIFRAKTKDGFGLKTLSEYLSNLLKFPPFQVNERGIFIRGMDQNGEVLADVEMTRESFTIFKCPKPINFAVNASHFYRLLKTIKKKDTVSLFILESRPMQLGICVEQGEDSGDMTTFVQLSYNRPDDIELPEGYGQPIVETSKRFQKLKMLQTIGPEMKATIINGSTVAFFVNGKNLYSREVVLGDNQDDGDQEQQASYTLTYSTNHITQLTKCASQSGNIQIFHHEELPLFVRMKICSLALLSVYIKSHELIEQLENDESDPESDQESTPAVDSQPRAKLNIEETGEEKETPDDESEEEAEEETEETGKDEEETGEAEENEDAEEAEPEEEADESETEDA